MKVPDCASTSFVRFLALLRLSSTLPDPVLILVPVLIFVSFLISGPALVSVPAPVPAPVPVPILCSSTYLHSRFPCSRSRPVAAHVVPVPILSPFARLHPRSRFRSVPVPITVYVPVPALDPVFMSVPARDFGRPPTPFAPSRPLGRVTRTVQCVCTDTGPWEWSCWGPASCILQIGAGARVNDDNAKYKGLILVSRVVAEEVSRLRCCGHT